MKNQVKERVEETRQAEQCHHFWNIEVANGPTSFGRCKYCGESREFYNAFPTFNPLRRHNNPMTLPEIPGIKVDEANKS